MTLNCRKTPKSKERVLFCMKQVNKFKKNLGSSQNLKNRTSRVYKEQFK